MKKVILMVASILLSGMALVKKSDLKKKATTIKM
jgi:hypothetical protein